MRVRGYLGILMLANLGIVCARLMLHTEMDGVILGVSSPRVVFVFGTDSAEAGAIVGTNSTYLCLTGLGGWPNATRIYEDSAGIRSLESPSGPSHNIELRFDSWGGDTSHVDSILVKLFDGDVQQGSTVIAGLAGSSTGELSMPPNATWRIQCEVRWKAGAQVGRLVDLSFTLIVK